VPDSNRAAGAVFDETRLRTRTGAWLMLTGAFTDILSGLTASVWRDIGTCQMPGIAR
jgi:hypothetical protein